MRRLKTFPIFIFLFLAAGSVNAAAPSDGFTTARKIESRNFTIHLDSGVDESNLAASLNIGPEHKILAGQSLSSSNSLGDIMDALFGWACGVLDMQLYSYRGTIKVAADENSLADIYRRLYGVERTGEKGFYIYEINTLYVSEGNFTKEIVGHEIAHAIISNFFVVQPPAKVQEVLAGYIEFQLRKKSRQ